MSNWTFLKFFSRARSKDPVTSHLAAESAHNIAGKHFQRIQEALKNNGPMGKDFIAMHSGLDPNQVARRLPEMQKLGLVETTGKLVDSISGRKERQWALPNQK